MLPAQLLPLSCILVLPDPGQGEARGALAPAGPDMVRGEPGGAVIPAEGRPVDAVRPCDSGRRAACGPGPAAAAFCAGRARRPAAARPRTASGSTPAGEEATPS